jgi:uncharacterized DUF497 family protein
MKITCDPSKRDWTLTERNIDLLDAGATFAGRTLTLEDDRKDYGEIRYQTYGRLQGRIVMIVWTPRGKSRHVISMRHCHDKEERKVAPYLD